MKSTSGLWLDESHYPQGESIIVDDPKRRSGEFLAWFGDIPNDDAKLSQEIVLPRGTRSIVVSCYYRTSSGSGEGQAKLQVTVSAGMTSTTIFEVTRQSMPEYKQFQRELTNPTPGSATSVTLLFHSTSDARTRAPFWIDDCSVLGSICPL